ncbi:MAG: glycosyl hydrolase 108 family protein [Novosphingobium sp.]
MRVADIEQLLEELLDREGGYVNHPADRGRPTNWGITQAVARAHGYCGDMQALSRDRAKRLYRDIYWQAPGFAAIAAIAPKIATEMFDTGVNMGPGVAVGFLQRALNALNRNGRDYADLSVDRQIGPITLTALRRFIGLRGKIGESVLLKAIEALQGERYIALAESRPANEAFLYGWIANRIG